MKMPPSIDPTDVMETIAAIVRSDIERYRHQASEQCQAVPMVTLTYAQSLDGSIAAQRGTPTLLSGSASMTMTHRLRTLHDGILVGIGTILADNPSLNSRLVDGPSPRPVVLDSALRCPLDIKLFTLPTCRPPILLYANDDSDESLADRRRALEAAGATVIACASVVSEDSGSKHIDVADALIKLRAHGVESVMIEGGAAIIQACLAAHASDPSKHLVSRIILTIAPTFIGGLHAVHRPVVAPGGGPFPRLRDVSYLQLDEDLIVVGQL
ncbi:hypothetical protein PINS_up004020 [Pythium insidiosum]|nr:hypothetical protein PINS_up004020 [Pythium insidiosum]